jgi:hypothetical protein
MMLDCHCSVETPGTGWRSKVFYSGYQQAHFSYIQWLLFGAKNFQTEMQKRHRSIMAGIKVLL